MSGLSPERREELAASLRTCRVGDGAPVRLLNDPDVLHVIWVEERLIAGWLAAEREAGAAEVRARVEAVISTWGRYDMPASAIRAALNGGE